MIPQTLDVDRGGVEMNYALLNLRTCTARKQHNCIWCGELIVIGEKYLNEQSVYRGNMQSHHWHLECYKACDEGMKKRFEYEFDPYDNERPAKQ